MAFMKTKAKNFYFCIIVHQDGLLRVKPADSGAESISTHGFSYTKHR